MVFAARDFETLGAMAGDAVGLICLLGYTTLPFLVMTPVALLGTKLGLPDAGSSGGLYYSEAVDAVPADQSLTGGLPDRF
ncbi:MAG: hypothetical protein ACLR2G_09680 [Phascolarctobacterium faecium]